MADFSTPETSVTPAVAPGVEMEETEELEREASEARAV